MTGVTLEEILNDEWIGEVGLIMMRVSGFRVVYALFRFVTFLEENLNENDWSWDIPAGKVDFYFLRLLFWEERIFSGVVVHLSIIVIEL